MIYFDRKKAIKQPYTRKSLILLIRNRYTDLRNYPWKLKAVSATLNTRFHWLRTRKKWAGLRSSAPQPMLYRESHE